MLRRDPLANAESLIRSVYAYVAYRIGDGPNAEDVTSDTFERALRYRASFDARRGEPIQWLIGIARHCIADMMRRREEMGEQTREEASLEDVEESTLRRLHLRVALTAVDERSRELIALRYGADLSDKQIGDLLDLKPGAVRVALHRALSRIRMAMEAQEAAAKSLRPLDSAARSLGSEVSSP